MKVSQLIAQLEELDGDAEVRVATQPGWPLRNVIKNVVADEDLESDDDPEDPALADAPAIVWIAVDQADSYYQPGESPYAPKGAWGW